MKKYIVFLFLCVSMMLLTSCGEKERYDKYYVNAKEEIVFGYHIPRGYRAIEKENQTGIDYIYKCTPTHKYYLNIREISKEKAEQFTKEKVENQCHKKNGAVDTKQGTVELFMAWECGNECNEWEMALVEINGHHIEISFDDFKSESNNATQEFKRILQEELF